MSIRRPLVVKSGVPAELPASDMLGGDISFDDSSFGLGAVTIQQVLDVLVASLPLILNASNGPITAADGSILLGK